MFYKGLVLDDFTCISSGKDLKTQQKLQIIISEILSTYNTGISELC